MTAPQINTLPTAPDRNDPAQFSTRADALVAALAGLVTQTNTVSTFVSEKSDLVATNTVLALDASTAAVGAANFKGAWSSLTGSLAIPASVSNAGAVWVLILNIPDVTASEPASSNSDWLEVKETLTKQTLTGAAQSVGFSKDSVVVSTANAAVVSYSFVNPSAVAKVDLIIDALPVDTYSITDGVYEEKFYQTTEDTAPRGIAWSNDGLKFFFMGSTNKLVNQFTATVAFDITTITPDGVTYDFGNDELLPSDLKFNPTGTKMYITGRIADEVNVFNLSTAFDLSTTTDPNISFSFAAQETNAAGMAFNAAFTKLYIVGTDNDIIFQYNLGTADDITTAVYANKSFDVSAQGADAVHIAFNPAGTRMYVMEKTNDRVHQYALVTADDVSTAIYQVIYFSVQSEESSPEAFTFNADGSRFYVVGLVTKKVFQYTTASISALVFPSTVQAPAVALKVFHKTALSIITADQGASYQVVNVTEGIK